MARDATQSPAVMNTTTQIAMRICCGIDSTVNQLNMNMTDMNITMIISIITNSGLFIKSDKILVYMFITNATLNDMTISTNRHHIVFRIKIRLSFSDSWLT